MGLFHFYAHHAFVSFLCSWILNIPFTDEDGEGCQDLQGQVCGEH